MSFLVILVTQLVKFDFYFIDQILLLLCVVYANKTIHYSRFQFVN